MKDWGPLNRNYFSKFWTLELGDQVVSVVTFGGGPSSCEQGKLYSVLMWQKEMELTLWLLLIRSLTNSISIGVRFQHMNFKETTFSL